MSSSAAHHSSWETSEVVFGIPLIISIVLGLIWPLPITHGSLRWIFLAIGVGLFILGAGVIISARRELARYGQPTDPGRPTSSIVTTGVFSISRNPLYLGIVIALFGLSLILNSWWVLIALVIGIILCQFVLIYPEERYLTSKFGEEYTAYVQTVHRWLGRA